MDFESPEKMPSAAERDRQDIEQKLRTKISSTFDKFANANDRVDDILKTVGNIFAQIENSEEIKRGLDELRNVEEKEEFCQRVFAILKPVLDWREGHMAEFEEIRRKDFNEQGGFIEINQMLSYGISGDSIHIHLPPNVSTPNSEKFRLFREAMQQLAAIAQEHPEIKTIVATSPIVAEHPRILEKKLNFTLQGPIDEETREKYFGAETGEIHWATMSREDLIKYYS